VGGGCAAVITILVPARPHVPGTRLELDEEEAHHLRVRRIGAGTEVQFRDGEGSGGVALLEADGRHQVVVVKQVHCRHRPPALVLAVGAGDKDRFAWVVEKAAELGVTEVVPLETERTTSVATRIRDGHVEKLVRRGREALKQSGAFWAPAVAAPETLERFLARPFSGARWLLDADGGPPPLGEASGPAAAIVGPEGGLTGEERATALAAGWRAVRAGPHVLRFETAAVAAATLIQAAREGRRDVG
jgi:16S rRNA (uracil1498-N3)-methyltransferase